ncbi:Sodium-independent sulfate anion transporter [Amphibalanus amphitrite]|uniref:Sodium-independent sulfate anion transporter n=1 Tax=Amphibalanus amphitrite TaxID=1232801 RepID=A0A6A4W6C1_AMPAM|nr:Sodium-independent sulfate anion transporter [Amphibalanus amphitrite]
MPPQNLASVSSDGIPADIEIPKFPVTPYQDEEDSSSAGDSNISDFQKIKLWASARASDVFTKDTLYSTLPILSWAPRYNRQDLVGDVIAGLTVGLTVIPQAIAYATLAGLPPNYGLYSSFVGCFVYCIFGSSRAVTIGPTAIMAMMTSEYGEGGNPDIATLLAFFTGIIILFAGIFQLGFLIDFMSGPVIAGFTSAAAITITVSQLKGIFGIQVDDDSFIGTIEELISKISETNIADLIMGIVCVAILICMREMRRIPIVKDGQEPTRGRRFLATFVRFSSIARNAILVMIAGLLVGILSSCGIDDLFTPTQNVDAGLPTPRPPPFSTNATGIPLDFSDMTSEIGAGFAIVPLLAVIENVAIAKAFSEGKRLDTTQEMIALGLSNICGSFFSAMPVTGSFSRTAVNYSSGVRTPFGGVFTGLLVICALQFLTPYFSYIPKAALSAIIIAAVIYMIELSVARPMWRSRKVDLLPFLATFFTGVFWGLEYGIGIGTAISLGMILFKAARPKVVIQSRVVPNTSQEYIYVYPDSGLTYPAAEHVRAVVTDAAILHGRGTEPVVVDCSHIRYSDFTSAECMNQLVKEFHERDQMLVFAAMKGSILRCWNGAGHGDARVTVATVADAERLVAGKYYSSCMF